MERTPIPCCPVTKERNYTAIGSGIIKPTQRVENGNQFVDQKKKGPVCNFCLTTVRTLLPSVLWHSWLGIRKSIRPLKIEWWGVGVVVCLQQGADLHMAQLMPLPITVSCFSKIQIGFTFLVPAHLCSPGKRAVKRVCVCVCVLVWLSVWSKVQIVCIWSSWCRCHPKTIPSPIPHLNPDWFYLSGTSLPRLSWKRGH